MTTAHPLEEAAVASIRGADRLRAGIEAGVAIAGGLELDMILPRFVHSACDLTGARYGALGVLDASGERLARVIVEEAGDENLSPIRDLRASGDILDAGPSWLNHIADEPRTPGVPTTMRPSASFLRVPVPTGGDVFGNLYLTDKEDGDFTEEDEQVAVLLAAQAGSAIENARLFAEARKHPEALEQGWRELASVEELVTAMVDGDSGTAVLQLLAGQALRSLDCGLVCVALSDTERSSLRFVAVAGDGGDRINGQRIAVNSSTAGAALLARRTVLLVDLASDPDARIPGWEPVGARSVLIVPVGHRFNVVGVMIAGHAANRSVFGADEERLLVAYANLANLVLEVSRALAAERDRAEALGHLIASETREAYRRETLRQTDEERNRHRVALVTHDETGKSFAPRRWHDREVALSTECEDPDVA
jgi:GAF domain-containing protein